MRIHIATDHAGLEFSHTLARHLTTVGHEVIDHGPTQYDPLDDYPAFCINAALGVARDQTAGIAALGAVFGGLCLSEQLRANQEGGFRAALVWSLDTALLARQHNDSNVMSVGARQHTVAEVMAFIDAFVAEPFSGEERHVRLFAQLGEYGRWGDSGGRGVDVVSSRGRIMAGADSGEPVVAGDGVSSASADSTPVVGRSEERRVGKECRSR